MSNTLWALHYEREKTVQIIYQGNFQNKPTCPPSILRRYWPEISDDAIENLAARPIVDDENNRRLEWIAYQK
jgi:hypothetical protein